MSESIPKNVKYFCDKLTDEQFQILCETLSGRIGCRNYFYINCNSKTQNREHFDYIEPILYN